MSDNDKNYVTKKGLQVAINNLRKSTPAQPWEDITDKVSIEIDTSDSFIRKIIVTPTFVYKTNKFVSFEARLSASDAIALPTRGYHTLRFYIKSDKFKVAIGMGASGAIGWHETQQVFTATGNIDETGEANEHSIRVSVSYNTAVDADYNTFIRWTQPIVS